MSDYSFKFYPDIRAGYLHRFSSVRVLVPDASPHTLSLISQLQMWLIDDQSIWQHNPSFIYMRFVTGGHVWKFLLEHFCIKLGCVCPKENSQSPNIIHISLENIFFFSPVTKFPSFITTTHSCVTIKHMKPCRDYYSIKRKVCEYVRGCVREMKPLWKHLEFQTLPELNNVMRAAMEHFVLEYRTCDVIPEHQLIIMTCAC